MLRAAWLMRRLIEAMFAWIWSIRFEQLCIEAASRMGFKKVFRYKGLCFHGLTAKVVKWVSPSRSPLGQKRAQTQTIVMSDV